MGTGTQLNMTDDGHLAVTKRASAGPGADRLRREADVLRRAAHPGVVELLGISDADGGAEMHTAFVGGGTVAEHLGSVEAARATLVAAALATTLADLHDRGVAHRRVTADHVLVTDADRIRLCGFADAAVRSEAGACDPEHTAADVEAVAAMVRELAGQATGADAAALAAVADRVLRADPPARPSMRTLAQALDALTGGPSSPPVAPGSRILAARAPVASSHRFRAPSARAALVMVGVAVAVTSAALVTNAAGPNLSGGPLAAPPSTTAAPDTRPSTTPAPQTDPRAGPRPQPQVVEVGGGVVSSSDRRWRVASPDDLVAVGDWDCDGIATPAVVHHGTGHVWTYPSWAEGSEAVVADPKATVPDPVSATAVATGGCHHLDVVDTTGKTTRLDLAR